MSKLIVVTGGTKGIGRAIAEKFAEHGFNVVVSARNQSDLDSMKKELEKNFSVSVYVQSVDMSKKDAVAKFSDFILSLNRTVDVLINNAGYFIPGEIADEKEGALESMIEANVYSAYYMTRGLVKKMKASRTGHIFN